MLLSELVSTSKYVAETRSRLKKIEYLAALLRHMAPDEIQTGVAYLTGDLRQGRIGLGYAMLRRADSPVAADSPALTVAEVHETFERIARTTGSGSSGERIRLLSGLLARGTREEQDFLKRLVLGELRQGALEGIMVDAIAQAAELPVQDVRRAVMLAGQAATVGHAALTEGMPGLKQFSLEVLQPVKPMLADSVDGVADALDRLGNAGFEFKLDGARVQVHKAGKDIRVFSRQLNDVTSAVPEIVEMVRGVPVRACILDGETLALKPDDTPLPFQTTMRRFGRKLDVEETRKTLPLTAFFFDCLHLDGEDLIDRPSQERFHALADALPLSLVIPRLVTDDREKAEAFVSEALAQGHEGVMAKDLNAVYEAGKRGSSWLKLKRFYTLDLVVLGAEWGSGRRRGWLSNLHLGAREPATNQFIMLGKTFKGMSDEMLQWQTKRLQELEVSRDAYTVYVRPELVVEIAFNEIQASTQYGSGLALRFARIKRYRQDKTVEEADTIETVRTIYGQQLARREA